MDAEQKAKELVDKFKIGLFMNGNPNHVIDHAKQCAIIACDEIIASDPSSPYGDGFYELHSDRIEEVKQYWEQVKEEINKL